MSRTAGRPFPGALLPPSARSCLPSSTGSGGAGGLQSSCLSPPSRQGKGGGLPRSIPQGSPLRNSPPCTEGTNQGSF